MVSSVNAYTSAMQAAKDAAGPQHYPEGALYMVATPIGNLADISLRALYLLGLANTVACEDTRHSLTLLRAYGIDKSPAQLLAVHQHNETEAASEVLARLRQGPRVAYISDAGTPGVSDPGARLVAAVRSAGLRTLPLPGPSSVTGLLSAAGVASDSAEGQGFVFAGFLPTKITERTSYIQSLYNERRCVILLEAPHRIEAAALALAQLNDRPITLGRELTKQFEEIVTLAARDMATWLQVDSNRLRGEFTLVIHPVEKAATFTKDLRVLKLLLAELPLKTAVRLTAEITGESKNDLYNEALALKKAAS